MVFGRGSGGQQTPGIVVGKTQRKLRVAPLTARGRPPKPIGRPWTMPASIVARNLGPASESGPVCKLSLGGRNPTMMDLLSASAVVIEIQRQIKADKTAWKANLTIVKGDMFTVTGINSKVVYRLVRINQRTCSVISYLKNEMGGFNEGWPTKIPGTTACRAVIYDGEDPEES